MEKMEVTKSAFANFILISFLVIITITVIIVRIKNMTIEILREKEKKIYEEQRKKELLLYKESTKKKQGGSV
jgi:hypothetical protein